MFYVDTIDPNKTIRTGIESMLYSLDPYTQYFPEDDQSELEQMLKNTYGGIEFQRLFRSGTLHLQFEARAYLPAEHLAYFLIILSCKVLAVDFHKNIACLQTYNGCRQVFYMD